MRDDLVVRLEGIDTEQLLEPWRWLIPASMRPWFANVLGDLFLVDDDGRVHWLDIGSGELQALAESTQEFEALAADPENAAVWFGEELADLFRSSGLRLQPGQCYSYRTLPMRGGTYDPDNFRACDLLTHFRVWGPIHEKLKDIPNGTHLPFVIT